MKTFNSFLALILAAGVISACKKEETQAVPFSGSIQIFSPSLNDTVSNTPSFQIVALAEANKEMHGYSIQVFDNSTEALLFEDQQHTHSRSYSIQKDIHLTITDTTALRLVIETAGDHADEKQSKTQHFLLIP